MKHDPMLAVVVFIVGAGLLYIYDQWAAARFDGVAENPLYLVGLAAALVLLWFNPMRGISKKGYWAVAALCIVAVFVVSAIFGSGESGIPVLHFGGGL